MTMFDEAKQKATTLNDDMKTVLDEVERGVYKRPIDVFDRMFNLADQFSDDMIAVLGDLQKNNILIDKMKLHVWWREEVGNYPSGESKIARFIRKLLKENEKAEKLLETASK